MRKPLEQGYPYAVATVAGVSVVLLLLRFDLPMREGNRLLEPIITISSIAVGFLATALAVLVSTEKSEFIEQLKRIDEYKLLLGYFHAAIRWCFAVSIASALTMVVGPRIEGLEEA